MKILAIDTSTDYLTLAVTDGDKVLARLHRKAARRHSSLLVPMIEGLMKRSRLRLGDLGAICIGVGPGSFTGLRIGVTTVKGLSYISGKPVVAVPTFDAIARNARRLKGVICVVLDARKGKVYSAIYRSDGKGTVSRISRYLLLAPDELLQKCSVYDNLYFTGDYAERFAALPAGARSMGPRWHPRAVSIAEIGARLATEGRFTTAEKLEPMYLYSRECDITGR